MTKTILTVFSETQCSVLLGILFYLFELIRNIVVTCTEYRHF